MINLVGNAIKFTEQGHIEVVARMVEGNRPLLAFDVVDTGIGIAPESMSRIFDPFAQGDTSITRRFGGTGLGLSICRFLADKMGGSVTARSQPGAGSCFTVTIDPGPLQEVKFITAPLSTDQPLVPTTYSADHATMNQSRILVVDDGEANRQLVSLYLQRSGVTVVTAANGQVALELVRNGGST